MLWVISFLSVVVVAVVVVAVVVAVDVVPQVMSVFVWVCGCVREGGSV